jgi:hypothetical protein
VEALGLVAVEVHRLVVPGHVIFRVSHLSVLLAWRHAL